MSRTRNYRFTRNNYENTNQEENIECQYIVYGKEIAPTTGTPHLQGFIRFLCDKSLKAARAALPGCDVRVSDFPQECIDYCKKDGDYTERGKAPLSQKEKGTGEKRRWAEIRSAAEEGRDDDLPDDIRYRCLHLNAAHRRKFLMNQTFEDTTCQMLWYWGGSGTGKSRTAREDHPTAYLKQCNKWGDQDLAYADVWIIEDFDREHKCLCHHLKIWADRYPFILEVKGGSIKVRPKLIIVTSNWHPSAIWDSTQDLEPILRRFKCVEFPKNPSLLGN